MYETSVNQFGVSVMSEFGKIKSSGDYYPLINGSEYKLYLRNGSNARCDAEVWIDNEKVGMWRINPHNSITIERPAAMARKFTFLEETSLEARSVGAVVGAAENGLVRVVFKPELERRDWYYGNAIPLGINTVGSTLRNCNLDHGLESATFSATPQYSFSSENTLDRSSAGITALGDHSNQRFNTTNSLRSIDTENITTINIRLVVDKRGRYSYRSLRPLSDIGYSNSVPPPIL